MPLRLLLFLILSWNSDHWRIQGLQGMDVRDAPLLLVHFFHFHAVFQKMWSNKRLELASPGSEIMDPLLLMLHWLVRELVSRYYL